VEDKRTAKTSFFDYEGFVDKFDAKKTTDDCYTPTEIYQAVIKFISLRFDLSDCRIVRPFYPGGDFQGIDYQAGDVVIDNPPFSMIAKISRFYIERKIKFFVFAPHLTLLSADLDCTAIVCGADIIYENGAAVKTSFMSNLFGDLRVMSAPSLYRDFCNISDASKVSRPKYQYPDHILTVSMVEKLTDEGISFELDKSDCVHCRGLDAQKTHGKSIFGSGLMLSEEAAAAYAAYAAAVAAVAAKKDHHVVWKLSDREMDIVKSLGRGATL